MAGDFNLVLDPDLDSINRTSTSNEKIVSTFVKDSMNALSLKDVYRTFSKEKGFTWNRGRCYSRLDMVFAQGLVNQDNVTAETDWTFDKSDHALLRVKIKFESARTKGPGLPKVDPKILEKSHIKLEVMERLANYINSIPEGWNPNQTWEFLKVSVRSIMW